MQRYILVNYTLARKALLLLSLLLMSAKVVKAEERTLNETYWRGIVFGSGSTICELVRVGWLSQENAKRFMSDSMETLAISPEMNDIRGTIEEAYKELIVGENCRGILQ